MISVFIIAAIAHLLYQTLEGWNMGEFRFAMNFITVPLIIIGTILNGVFFFT